MKKPSTFLKTLLVAVCLIGAGSNAWAYTLPTGYEIKDVIIGTNNGNGTVSPEKFTSGMNLSLYGGGTLYHASGENEKRKVVDYSGSYVAAPAVGGTVGESVYPTYVGGTTDEEKYVLQFQTRAEGNAYGTISFNNKIITRGRLIFSADLNFGGKNKNYAPQIIFVDKDGNNVLQLGYKCGSGDSEYFQYAVNGGDASNDGTVGASKLRDKYTGHSVRDIEINMETGAVVYTVDYIGTDGKRYSQTSTKGVNIGTGKNIAGIRISRDGGVKSESNYVYLDNVELYTVVPTSVTTHTYTINAKAGETTISTLATNTCTEYQDYSFYLPKVILYNSKFYVLDGTDFPNYLAFYTMGTANEERDISYTLDESIAYYAESENMTGSRYSYAVESNKCSKGTAYCSQNSDLVTKCEFDHDGKFNIEVGMAQRSTYTPSITPYFKKGDSKDDLPENISVSSGGYTIKNYSNQRISAGYELGFPNDNGTGVSKWALDYVIIRKAYYVGGATPSISNGAYVPFTLSTMTFTFSDAYTSEEASFAVLNSATAKLYNSSNEEIATGTLSVSGNVVTADFDNYTLSAGSTYTITLPAGAVGYDGQISNSATSITVHTCAVTDGTYYLKNKATGAYFAAGLSWGTQAITNSIGHYVTVNSVLPAGTYTLNTHIYKIDSKHFLGSDLFCDGANYEWAIESAGEGYYTISNGSSTITAGASGEALSLTSGTGDNTKWSLLTEGEWKAEQVARLDAATANNGVDATFYLPAANFNRCDDDENAKWQGSPAISGLGNNTASTNFNAEKFTDPYATFDVYQALTGVKPGVYKLTAQGFYRNGLDNATDANDNLALLYANSTTVPLVNIRSTGYTDNSHSEEGFSTDKSGYYVPDSQGDASKTFNAGYYQNELNAFVDEDGTLRIGVKKEAATGADKDWACFDNFQLTYYGEAIVSVATAFTNGASMTAGQWYYYDINFADSYTLTSETALANIVYTTDGTQMLNAGATFESSTPALTVGRYYIKSSTTQTLTITRANSGTYYWDFTDTSIWETSDFTSEATYKSDGTSGTLGANGIYFNLSGNVTVSESDGISFNKNASPESITDKIPTTNYIRVSVPAGYKAAVEYYGYNSTRSVYFNFGGTETKSGAVAYTRRYFDNSEGTVPVDLYIYGNALDGNGRAKIYNINMIDMSTPTHTWTATAKATIDGVSTVIDSWTSSSGNYTTTIHEDEYYYVPAKRVITYKGKKYELNDNIFKGSLLYKNWKMGNANVNYDITYTEASDIAYYTEIENVYNSQITNSNKASGGQYVNFMNKVTRSAGTFTIGSYTVEANMLNRSPGNNTNFYLYPTSSANSALASFSGSTEGIQTYDFDLASSTELVFGADGSNNSAACDYILIRKTAEPATLGTNGYGTFASPYPLDLANLPEGLTAYKASTISGKTVTFTAVAEAVQANTGLLLKGDASESETIVSIPVAASGDDISASNQFLVNTAGTTFTGDADYYYFGLKKNTLTFGLFDPSTVAIPANKAYLKVLKSSVDSSVGDSRSLSIVFDDEATGVGASLMNNEERTMNNEVYDLQGRRVDGSRLTVNGSRLNPGIYIKNGRKVVVK